MNAVAAQERKMPAVRKARNLIWSVPVGLQLSIVYTLISAITLTLLGWALYTQLEGFLVQNTAQRLDRITHPILVRSFPPGQNGGPGEPDSPGQSWSVDQAASALVQQLSGPDSPVAVLDANGNIISASQSPSGGNQAQIPALPAEWAVAVKNGTLSQAVQWIVSIPGSERQLVVLTPIILSSEGPHGQPSSAGVSLYLEQVASLGAADAVLGQLKLYIVLGILAGTILGVLAGMALTRAILRPLERMVSTAEAIADGDLKRRLRLPPGHNEVARLGTAFDHMVERLGAALDAQKRFVADASHELRTPLTSLEGLSEMLLMGADKGNTSVVQRTARAMHGELARLGRLVADLLALSRLDSTARVALVPADLCQVVAEVAQQMEPAAMARGISLVTSCGEPSLVSGEPDKLKQVVLNLTDNALRYTPAGGEVALSTAFDVESKQVRVLVRDTGSGIAPEDLPHIFDRFYRGDPSRTRSTGNSGLGLAIVRALVEAHGGTIAVESTIGAGTCFTIAIPALAPATGRVTSAKTKGDLVGRKVPVGNRA